MKHIFWKAYWNYEKEEKWLNEMAAKGMALTDYSWCRYVFTETPCNEYTYRIELLAHMPSHPESLAYLRFLEENNIEIVATYFRWVFLRKKSSEGTFDIYTDIESQMKHFKRVNLLWTTFMWIELILAIFLFASWIVNVVLNDSSFGNHAGIFNIVEGCFLLLLGFGFFKLSSPIRKKLKKLEQEKTLRE